jgi:hypothetical protein
VSFIIFKTSDGRYDWLEGTEENLPAGANVVSTAATAPKAIAAIVRLSKQKSP